ncbi:MAG: hypothetical protein AAGI03_06205 [Pseudomonadota bacterium]
MSTSTTRGGAEVVAHPNAMAPPGASTESSVAIPIIKAAARLNEAEGLAAVGNAADQAFSVVHGAELAGLDADIARDARRIEQAAAERDNTAEELAATPEWVPGAVANAGHQGGASRSEVPFAAWQFRHQFTALLCLLAGFTVLGTSLLTVSATLRDSGLPIMIEQPLLPWLMAAIAPTGSIAIKAIAASFRDERTRKRMRSGIYAAAVLSFLIWLGLFALKFEGVSGDFNPFAEPNPFVTWAFNALQILSEVLIGAALFAQVDGIAAVYAPDYHVQNLRHGQLTERRDALDAEIDALMDRQRATTGRKAELEAIRTFNRATAELAVREHRARFGDGLI